MNDRYTHSVIGVSSMLHSGLCGTGELAVDADKLVDWLKRRASDEGWVPSSPKLEKFDLAVREMAFAAISEYEEEMGTK